MRKTPMGTPHGPLDEEGVAIQLAKFAKDCDEREILPGPPEVAAIEAPRRKPPQTSQPQALTQEGIEAPKALWQLEPWRPQRGCARQARAYRPLWGRHLGRLTNPLVPALPGFMAMNTATLNNAANLPLWRRLFNARPCQHQPQAHQGRA